ncbi:copper chaperone PCu(A)C [Jannaschia sp. S6380]|uniref:copper chaperone PCu(A)C n=1 Tax=Jannaschia sp. S6380 TaxID=2926408 RepID=UPI001FF4E010|nr:copper chaperone PCu(A)C [Jannaschia sp. S6380]MCK0166046.1 copper chaperone PCu(A)C [Jannaschia sp. S6380]
MTRIFALLLVTVCPAYADIAHGDLQISLPMLRDTPPTAPVAGGFMTIANMGDADDVLTTATIDADFVGEVQLHKMEMEDGVMKMSEVEGGIAVPAGETVYLQPGGLHLMLMGLSEPLTAGEAYEMTLTFAEAGDVVVEFPVLTLGEIRATLEEAGTMDHGMKGHGEDATQTGN